MFRHGQIDCPDSPPIIIDLHRGTTSARQPADLVMFAGTIRIQIVAKSLVGVIPPVGAPTTIFITNSDAVESCRWLWPHVDGVWKKEKWPRTCCSGSLSHLRHTAN